MKLSKVIYTTLAISLALACKTGALADDFNQKASTNGIKAEVSISPLTAVDYRIEVDFESKTYPVGCLSAYRDIHYELRDANGRLVPISAKTLANPPFEGPQTAMHVMTGNWRSSDCKLNAPMGVWYVHSRLSALYPNLPPGAYTLKLSLAPRGLSTHADYQPVQLNINGSTPTP